MEYSGTNSNPSRETAISHWRHDGVDWVSDIAPMFQSIGPIVLQTVSGCRNLVLTCAFAWFTLTTLNTRGHGFTSYGRYHLVSGGWTSRTT